MKNGRRNDSLLLAFLESYYLNYGKAKGTKPQICTLHFFNDAIRLTKYVNRFKNNYFRNFQHVFFTRFSKRAPAELIKIRKTKQKQISHSQRTFPLKRRLLFQKHININPFDFFFIPDFPFLCNV